MLGDDVKGIMFQVSSLFAKDEIDEITNELIIPMKHEFPRLPPTRENLYKYFITRARTNLHVVLCFSPVCNLCCMPSISKYLISSDNIRHQRGVVRDGVFYVYEQHYCRKYFFTLRRRIDSIPRKSTLEVPDVVYNILHKCDYQ